jgi:signal transduction histidine kinase
LRYGWPASDCATDGEGGPLIAIPLQAEQQDIAVLTLRLQESYLGASLWRSALPGIAAILATLAALAVVLSIVLRRQVVRPIRDLTEAMRLLSRGRTDFVLPRPGGRDEIAEMAETLIVFRNTKIEADRVAGELREAQGELIESAKLAFLGSMVAGVAHEVNTPLGICVTSVATARDLLAEIERRLVTRQLTEAELLSFFTKLKQSDTLVLANLERAATLIRSFKGIAADQASETPRRIEIGAYLREIAASLQPELKRTRIDLRVEVEHEIHATVPPGTLWQIFSNLVLNGVIHAFEPGASGTITLRAAMQSGDRVRLSYHDDGKGMTPEVRAHIFEPFFTTRRGQGGTGLGLFITYQLVTQTLGGRIQCHSQPGHGAHFDIVFPATPPSSEA